MAYRNKVELIGNLGNDPEIRFMPDGQKVATISVATTERWTDKQSKERRERTEWHKVVFYRGLADVAGEHLKKGSQVFIEGKLRTEQWTDKDTGADRSRVVIVAEDLQMLGRAPKDDNRADPFSGDDSDF